MRPRSWQNRNASRTLINSGLWRKSHDPEIETLCPARITYLRVQLGSRDATPAMQSASTVRLAIRAICRGYRESASARRDMIGCNMGGYECNCFCHKGGKGTKAGHIVACCSKCVNCGKRIRRGRMDDHLKKCRAPMIDPKFGY